MILLRKSPALGTANPTPTGRSLASFAERSSLLWRVVARFKAHIEPTTW